MNQKKTKTKIFLLSIFLITVIPVIYVYLEHASVEAKAHEEAKTETKKIKTEAEGLLFVTIFFGYIICTGWMLLVPQHRTPYLIIIIGTVAINFLYWFRLYGIPIPGTEIVITDLSSDWRDVVTKICQQILVIPTTALLIINTRKE